MTDRPAPELTYAEGVEELNAIIRELDGGVVDVDRLTIRFQRAIDIVEDLDGRIRRARDKVEELAPRLDAITSPPDDPDAEAPY